MECHLPLVTIGIPTYNQGHYIKDAIESALAQRYPNLEIVIADDCSLDNTKKICERYLGDNRVKYFRNETNIGRVLNYRKLFYEYASGDWYVNLDGDDYYTDKNFISTGINIINSFTEKGYDIMFYHSAFQTMINDRLVPVVPNISQEYALISGEDYFNQFFRLNASSHLTVICNRTKALTINYYSSNTLFTDVHSFLRLALHGYIILDKSISAVWRTHENNASLTLEGSINDEIAAKEDISKYAVPFVGERRAKAWLHKAKNELINNLVYKNVQSDSVSYRDWIRYFKYFRFSGFFIKHFFKYFFLFLKKRKKKLL